MPVFAKSCSVSGGQYTTTYGLSLCGSDDNQRKNDEQPYEGDTPWYAVELRHFFPDSLSI